MRAEIAQYPGYYADENGRIYSTIRGTWHELSQNEHNGFYEVHLVAKGKKINVPVHRLILYAFVGPRPDGCHAVHLNHDNLDNCLDNLCWSHNSGYKRKKIKENKAQSVRTD